MSALLPVAKTLQACKRVQPATGSRTPIQGCIRVSASDGQVYVQARDDAFHFGASFENDLRGADVDMVVAGRVLIRFLESIEERTEPVAIKADEAFVHLSCGDLDFTMGQIDVDEWPRGEAEVGTPCELDADDLASIQRVVFAASTDEGRGPIVGAHVGNGLVTCTDNFRLARAEISPELQEGVIPTRLLGQSIVKRADRRLEIAFGERTVRISDGHGFWAAQLITGNFPDVTPLVDFEPAGQLRLSHHELSSIIEFASHLDEGAFVTLASRAGSMTIDCGRQDTGRIQDRVTVEGDWQGELLLKTSDLRDALRSLQDDVITVSVAPTKFVSIKDGKVLNIVQQRPRATPN